MFGRVAPRYDLLNHLLSGQIDRYWRWRLVREVRPYLRRDGTRVADFCCGTGDLALALARERRRIRPGAGVPFLATDFCRPMLQRAKRKIRRADLACVLAEADATRMPLPDGCLDLITIAYGFRNLANYRRAAQEFTRLLAPGGCLAILEFSTPTSRIWRGLFETYFRHVLPRLGNAISGSGGAYSYLQESVQRFPEPEEVRSLLVDAGFPRVETRSLSGGVSVLYLAYG
jgi:demethylmenaquinone methyltransferase/2-methoxy-6-polyprenyl-1,4-benzoquinol methylase